MPDDKKAYEPSAATLAHIDELLDEALKQTFPASDPVAINIERPRQAARRKAPTFTVRNKGADTRPTIKSTAEV